MSEFQYMIVDECGDGVWRDLILCGEEADLFSAIQDGLESFGRAFVREPISLTRTIELLPMDHFFVEGPSRRSKGKGRKAHKAFQRKLGGGW